MDWVREGLGALGTFHSVMLSRFSLSHSFSVLNSLSFWKEEDAVEENS